jgi:hypothetical protein
MEEEEVPGILAEQIPGRLSRFDQLVLQPLMVALPMRVATEFFDAVSGRSLAEEDRLLEAFFLKLTNREHYGSAGFFDHTGFPQPDAHPGDDRGVRCPDAARTMIAESPLMVVVVVNHVPVHPPC